MSEEKKDPFTRLGAKVRGWFSSDGEEEKESGWRNDSFWLYRWFMDWKYKRVGLTTITWLGEEYGYRMDYDRIPKKQIEEMRRKMPCPVHKSNSGWREWVLIRDPDCTPFPEVKPAGSQYYNPTAVDLYLYMTNKDLDNALTFKKKNQVPIDGKMLVLCIGAIAVAAFVMLGVFSQ